MRRAASLLLPLLLGLSGVDAFLGSGLCSRVSAPARSPRGLGLRGGATTLSSCGAAAAQPLASKAPRPLPATFRQLYAAKPGSGVADVAAVRELPMLSPGPGQALIEVRYAGVNGGCETFRARANYWFERNKDAADGFALGAEGAGVVAAVGECDPTQRPSRLSSARPEILSPLTAGARGAGEFPVAFASNPPQPRRTVTVPDQRRAQQEIIQISDFESSGVETGACRALRVLPGVARLASSAGASGFWFADISTKPCRQTLRR